MGILHHSIPQKAQKVSDFAFLWHCEDFLATVGYVQYDKVGLVTIKKKFGSKSVDPKYSIDGSYAVGWESEKNPGQNLGGNPFTLSGDFTYDFWACPTVDGGYFGLSFEGRKCGFERLNATTAGTCTWGIGYTVTKYDYTHKVISWPLRSWGHIAVIRQGDNHYILYNGKVVYFLNDASWVSSVGSLFICGEDTYYNSNATYIDEVALRLFAAWDCSGAVVGDQVFTPPTAPYEA